MRPACRSVASHAALLQSTYTSRQPNARNLHGNIHVPTRTVTTLTDFILTRVTAPHRPFHIFFL